MMNLYCLDYVNHVVVISVDTVIYYSVAYLDFLVAMNAYS